MAIAKKIIKKFLIALIPLAVAIFLTLVLIQSPYQEKKLEVSGQPVLDNYTVGVMIMSDGSALIEEEHSLHFDDRGRPWWNYYKQFNASFHQKIVGFSAIVGGVLYDTREDVDIDGLINSPFDRGEFAYINDNGSSYEIGVVMNEFTAGDQSIILKYTIKNAVDIAKDVAVFYYQFVAENNSVPIRNMEATVYFPDSSEGDLYTWLHLYDAADSSYRVLGNSEAKYTATNVHAGNYVETRLTMSKDAFINADLAYSDTDLDTIIAEEKEWYDESIALDKRIRTRYVVDITVSVILLVAVIGYVIYKNIRRRPYKVPDAPEYVREAPQDWTVEEAMPIYHYYDKEDWSTDCISATIMNLIRRGFISVKMPEEKKKDALLCLETDPQGLSPYESSIFNMLKSYSDDQPFTMEGFEKWAKEHSGFVAARIKEYKSTVAKKTRFMIPKPINTGMSFALLLISLVLSLSLNFLLSAFGVPYYLICIALMAAGVCNFIFGDLQNKPLSRAGQQHYEYFQAFGRYMLDFGNFDDKDIPELEIWEEYLVWATGMGIADKVSEQLAVVYPQYAEIYNSDIATDTFIFWYLFAPTLRRTMSINIARTMLDINTSVIASNAMSTALNTARTAGKISGGFGGGGFGRGGGGFRGGGGGFGGGMGAR